MRGTSLTETARLGQADGQPGRIQSSRRHRGETGRDDPAGNKRLFSQLLALWAGLRSASIGEVFLEAVWYLLTFSCRVELASRKHVCAHACERQERSCQR